MEVSFGKIMELLVDFPLWNLPARAPGGAGYAKTRSDGAGRFLGSKSGNEIGSSIVEKRKLDDEDCEVRFSGFSRVLWSITLAPHYTTPTFNGFQAEAITQKLGEAPSHLSRGGTTGHWSQASAVQSRGWMELTHHWKKNIVNTNKAI